MLANKKRAFLISVFLLTAILFAEHIPQYQLPRTLVSVIV